MNTVRFQNNEFSCCPLDLILLDYCRNNSSANIMTDLKIQFCEEGLREMPIHRLPDHTSHGVSAHSLIFSENKLIWLQTTWGKLAVIAN